MIPYGRQDISESDIESVLLALQSEFLTQGPCVENFESIVAEHVGAKFAVCVNSATSALHIGCLALGLGPKDWMWTSPITFVASANCGIYCGASVDFVDIDPHTYNICPKALEDKLICAAESGRLPKVLIAVHFSGQSCEMETIYNLSRQYGFSIIEDASHAVGGSYKGERVGNCCYSDITVFSFHPVKIITTAEGGMALTNNEWLATKMSLLRTHGITRDPKMMFGQPDGSWYYQQICLGFNYRMSDLHAALGVSQMKRLQDYVSRRNELAMQYDYAFRDFPVVTPWHDPRSYSARHLYVIRLKLDKISKSHIEVFESMRERGVGVNLHYIPVHLQPYYRNMGFKKGDFPEAERYYSEAISLPIFSAMTAEQQSTVVSTLRGIICP